MNYVVFDLEWNQGSTAQQTEHADIPFEVIEIGAVKLNDSFVMINEFSRLIKPEVYLEMHQYTSKLIHLQMEELERGKPFAEVTESFLEWCGPEEYMFCSWGSLDLTELQRNMRYHNMTQLSDGPIAFLDVQKLFSLAFEDGKSRRSLESAVDMMQLEKDIPFHRAFSDAYYTAKLLTLIAEQKPQVLRRISFDTFHPPKSREQEVKVQFDTYMKYISREFDSKTEAFADKEVASSKCYLCHRNLRKKVRWFSPNSRHYYCLARCDKHGFLKGKIRVHRSETGKVFIVKITKLITEEEAEKIKERSSNVKKLQRNRHCDKQG
ncbi:MAG: exonuclease domain-containing protein [Acetatifactor sp.]